MTRKWTRRQALSNYSKHVTEIYEDFISGNFGKILQWSKGNSDLNPLENIWSWLKRQVTKDQPHSREEFENSLIKHWKSINMSFSNHIMIQCQSVSAKLLQSMVERLIINSYTFICAVSIFSTLRSYKFTYWFVNQSKFQRTKSWVWYISN